MAPNPSDNGRWTPPAARRRLRGGAAAFGLLLRSVCAVALLLVLGCSEFTGRNISSLLFDGVPAPPEPDVYCAPWLAAKQAI